MIECGQPEYLETSLPSSQAPVSLENLAVLRASSDLTSHREPDRDHDMNQCVLVYRHNGRIIHRTTPLKCDIGVIRWWTRLAPVALQQPLQTVDNKTQIIEVQLTEFYGRSKVSPRHKVLLGGETSLQDVIIEGPPIAISA